MGTGGGKKWAKRGKRGYACYFVDLGTKKPHEWGVYGEQSGNVQWALKDGQEKVLAETQRPNSVRVIREGLFRILDISFKKEQSCLQRLSSKDAGNIFPCRASIFT